jgi:hypothetical protein
MEIEYKNMVACDEAWQNSPGVYDPGQSLLHISPPLDTDRIFRARSDLIRLEGTAYLAHGEGLSQLEALRPGTRRVETGRMIIVDGQDTTAFVMPATHCMLCIGAGSVEITFQDRKDIATVRLHKKDGREAYTSPDISCIFNCISDICSNHAISSPDKSNPLLRGAPPSIRVMEGFEGRYRDRRAFSFHLPRDLRYLYSAAPLAYYLGASVEEGDRPYITFEGHERMLLPTSRNFEAYAGEALCRTFYMDCAVRYEASSGNALPGVDLWGLFGYSAGEIFDMSMEERFLLYANSRHRAPYPMWHMASYLDPVPSSVEALPFLLRSLSAVYSPEYRPASEREIVESSYRAFMGQGSSTAQYPEHARSIVMPSLHSASSQYWFSKGYPVDATKTNAAAFENRLRFDIARGRKASVGIICNEGSMEGEIRDIVREMAGRRCEVEVLRNVGVREFADAFAAGYQVVQFIGHCDANGFKCSDGFARAADIAENNTPMFFFNSCSCHSEAMHLIENGSVCGIATMFRVIDEIAIDMCQNFYYMFGAGYSAHTSLNAAKACSTLGKEYMLLGDGSYTCFGSHEARPFFEILRREGGYALRCTMDGAAKGSIVTAWHLSNSKPVTDLGFETRALTAEHLLCISKELNGYCLYDRHIYRSVDKAAKQLKKDEASTRYRGKRSRFRG